MYPDGIRGGTDSVDIAEQEEGTGPGLDSAVTKPEGFTAGSCFLAVKVGFSGVMYRRPLQSAVRNFVHVSSRAANGKVTALASVSLAP